jgi:hypothetical protein
MEVSLASEEPSLVSRMTSKSFYQRSIPLFIVSLLVGIYIADYFAGYEGKTGGPLTPLTSELNTWGTIISLFILLFSNVVLLAMHFRTAARERVRRKELFRSVSFIGSAAFFVILAFASGPKLTSGPQYTLVWTAVYGTMGLGIAIGHHTFFTWHAMRRLRGVTSADGIALLVSTVLSLFLYTTAVTPVFPQFDAIANWIKGIPNTAAQRSALAAAAVGGIILGVRALVWKEPGLIEREM